MHPIESHSSEIILDLQGFTCPEPLIAVRKKLREIKSEEYLTIIADDPITLRDIPYYCKYMDLAFDIVSDTPPFVFRILNRTCFID